jgi:Protein of unknown function (DUF1592)/Protein of unknown function (DUF1588)/Protein of unknown function (DUF1595)/Protein of unknown function (DUF1585)/Protein of unknown function (DUF1587)
MVTALLTSACSGELIVTGQDPAEHDPGADAGPRLTLPFNSGTPTEAAGPSSVNTDPNQAGTGAQPSGTTPLAATASGGAMVPPDSATLPVHHLTAAEYNNSVAQLLGTELRPADFFPAAGSSEFDANVGVLASLSQVSVQGYLDAARDLAQDTFDQEQLRARIVTCDPSQADESACVAKIITDFGRRAFRRPLENAEIERYVGVYEVARSSLKFEAMDALQHVVRSLLSSPHFFLRVELGTGAIPEIATPDFALASRLSYLVWSSMPDDELLAAAENGELATPQQVTRQVDRLLADPKSAAFYRDFFGQWLETRSLASHNADTMQFPNWDDALRDAQIDQVNAFYAGFVDGTHAWNEVLTAPHPESPALATILGRDPEDIRRGFLTLPAFLTQSSHADRTSPTARAKAVMGGLLCTNIAVPANVDIPELSAAPDSSIAEDNIRARIEMHRADPDCAGCHAILDPIGLSLEHFDPIGGYRDQYGNGDPIDASGEYAGKQFSDVRGLLPILTEDARLGACPPRKLYTYALRRSPSDADLAQIASIAAAWQGDSIASLMKLVATSEAFLSVLRAEALEGNEP